jgi:hypothetical protein
MFPSTLVVMPIYFDKVNSVKPVREGFSTESKDLGVTGV